MAKKVDRPKALEQAALTITSELSLDAVLRSAPRSLAKEDEDPIVGLAAFAAVAIENARLYTEAETQLKSKVYDLEQAGRHLWAPSMIFSEGSRLRSWVLILDIGDTLFGYLLLPFSGTYEAVRSREQRVI